MKKFLCVAVMLVTLVSCGKASEVYPVLNGISFTAEVTYYNEAYSCVCTVSSDGVLTAEITEPEPLDGFTLTVSRDSVTAEYLGISYTPNTGNMPFSGVVDSFYRVLCEISDSGCSAVRSGDRYTVTGGEGAGAYTLYIAPTGLPLKLDMPDERFTVSFYNISIVN